MGFPRKQLLELMSVAVENGQRLTSWNVGHYANQSLLENFRAGEYHSPLDRRVPLKFYGIDVLERDDMPTDQIALISGDETVGVVTIDREVSP